MFQQSKRSKMIESDSFGDSVKNETTPETDTNNELVAHGVSASVTISLHPLVIMNMCDHFTRIKAQEGTVPKVFGAFWENKMDVTWNFVIHSNCNIAKPMMAVSLTWITFKIKKNSSNKFSVI